VSPFVSTIPIAKTSCLYGLIAGVLKTVIDFQHGANACIENDRNRKTTSNIFLSFSGITEI
jgi:hypothetical protein